MRHINAQQTLLKFRKDDAGTLLYAVSPETYSQLAENKVIKAWVTEGHSVAIPGLGSLRFSMNANAVADVNDVAKSNSYSHNGSFSQPLGKPIVAVSMAGLAESCVSIFAFISLPGKMMFKKYLIV